LAADDLFELTPGHGFEADAADRSVRANVQLHLQNNTLAVRRSAFRVHALAGKHGPIVEALLILAEKNLFVDPFLGMPRSSCLLDIAPAALHSGLVLWQGKGNAYDERWSTFLPAALEPVTHAA